MDNINSKQETGKTGEELAVNYLKNQGYKIIERNVRTPSGEIDIIVKKNNVLGFVEVRTRHSDCYDPVDTIGAIKQRRVLKSAFHYMGRLSRKPEEVKFHAVGVNLGKDGKSQIDFIEDAFR
jgi:putative endonuclease